MDRAKFNLDIFKIRILRTGKLTLLMASAILIVSVLVFNMFAAMLERVMYTMNAGDNIILLLTIWLVRYGIALVVVGYCLIMCAKGEWDLNYKLIVRHRLKDKKYQKVGEYTEKLGDIYTYSNGEYHNVGNIALIKVYELEKQECLFVRVNGYYMALRDIKVEGQNIESLNTLIITKYKYLGHQLLKNSDIYGYEFKVCHRDLDEQVENVENIENITFESDYTNYFKHSMETNETDLKDSFKEDMHVGMKYILRGAVAILIMIAGYSGYNYFKLNTLKAINESQGLIVESTVCGVKVLFDDANDTWLMPHINSSLVQVNENVLKRFVAEDWKIRITSENMESTGFYFGWQSTGSISGATSFPYKYIIIPDNLSSVDGSVIHELGHFIDSWEHATKDAWANIYHTEKHKYLRDYARVNQFEGFACAYMEYVLVGDSLKNRCPETYEYIDNIIKTVYGENFDVEQYKK